MDDLTFIKRISDGDRSAVRLLVENNKNLVWHVIISMTGHNPDSEDLFQETFLQVFKGIGHFRGDARISTWIGSIAHHICIDYLRRKKRRKTFFGNDENQMLMPEQSISGDWKQTENNDLKETVWVAVTKLPAVYRTAITLYHLDECSYEEIAEITGLPIGTVKSHISRGRNMLREILVTLVPDLTEILHEL